MSFDSSIDYIVGDVDAYFDILPFIVIAGNNCEEYSKNFSISCEGKSAADLPDLVFTYENITFGLSSDQIWKCKNGVCHLQIQFTGNGWVMGIVFMQNYFVIYDFDNSRIGIAPAVAAVVHKSYSNVIHVVYFFIFTAWF